METDLYSFKILFHRILIERNIFRPSYTAIERPSFSVRVFNYPSFIVYGSKKINAEEVQSNEYIKFGNGKSTSFDCLTDDIKNLAAEIPLLVSFVDASPNCLTVIAKSFIGLQLFAKDLDHVYENSLENWKRNVFEMHDEGQNLIGRIDLSISFVRRTRNNFNQRAQNPTRTLTQTLHAPEKTPQVDKGTLLNPLMPTQKLEKKEEIIQTESHYNWDMNNTKKIKFQDEVQAAPNDASNRKRATSAKQSVEKKASVIAAPTLKTIVESHYCPPVMYFQKKNEKVISHTGEDFNKKENFDVNKGYQTTGGYGTNSGFKKKPKPILTNQRRGTEDDIDRSFESDKRPQTAQPIIVLSQKESNDLVRKLGLNHLQKTQSSGGGDRTDGLLDALITELLTLKNRQRSNKPSPRADSFEDSTGRSPNKRNSLSSTGNKILGSDIKSQPEYYSPQFPPRIANNSYVGANAINPSQILPNSSTTKSNMISNNSPVNNPNKPPKKEVQIPVVKEESSVHEEYTQDFESLSISQNISGVRGSKELANSRPNPRISQSNISESYPDDFEVSANLSARPEKKNVTFKESQSIGEDISMSTSLNTKAFDRLIDHFKKPDRLDSRISEYSEDFEALSEDG